MKNRHALSLPQNVIETMAFVLCSALVSFTPLHGAEPPAVAGASYALLKVRSLGRRITRFHQDFWQHRGSTASFGRTPLWKNFGGMGVALSGIHFGYLPGRRSVRTGARQKRKLDDLWSGSYSFGLQSQFFTAELDQAVCGCKRRISLLSG